MFNLEGMSNFFQYLGAALQYGTYTFLCALVCVIITALIVKLLIFWLIKEKPIEEDDSFAYSIDSKL